MSETVKINLVAKPYYNGVKSLDGNAYRLRFRWNLTTEKWYMDIEGLTNDVGIRGLALTCGKNLLEPYGYSELGELWMIDNSGADEDPNYDDIGGRFTLEYTTIN